MNAKKILSILLVITMILPLCTGFVSAQSFAAVEDSQSIGINYAVDDVIVTGTIDGNPDWGYFINLTDETITVPSGYKVAAYSINNGQKWTSLGSKIFDDEALAKLFSKDLTLAITDKYDSKAKKPASDATTVKFATIKERPSMKKYEVNYLIGADPTGETAGMWLLSEKNKSTSAKEYVDVAVADSTGKKPDSNGYGRFYGSDGTTNGIAIKELPSNNKAVSTVYYIRDAARENSNGTYTAASKSSKITVKGQSKPSTYSVSKTKKTISYSANTYIFTDKAELKTVKGKLDVSEGGDVYLWKAATDSAPASAMQKISVTPGEKSITYTSSIVTGVPKSYVASSDIQTNDLLENPAANNSSTSTGLDVSPYTTYTKGSGMPLEFAIEKDYSTFKNATVNGTPIVEGKDYTVQVIQPIQIVQPTVEPENTTETLGTTEATEATDENKATAENENSENKENENGESSETPTEESNVSENTEETTANTENTESTESTIENISEKENTELASVKSWAGNGEAASGSMILTLSESFLNGLSAADYVLAVNFTDDTVLRYFTIAESQSMTTTEPPTQSTTEPATQPTAEPPAESAPTTEPPTEQSVTTEQPTTEKATEQPTTEKATEQPTTEKATEQPTTEKATQQPTTEKAIQSMTEPPTQSTNEEETIQFIGPLQQSIQSSDILQITPMADSSEQDLKIEIQYQSIMLVKDSLIETRFTFEATQGSLPSSYTVEWTYTSVTGGGKIEFIDGSEYKDECMVMGKEAGMLRLYVTVTDGNSKSYQSPALNISVLGTPVTPNTRAVSYYIDNTGIVGGATGYITAKVDGVQITGAVPVGEVVVFEVVGLPAQYSIKEWSVDGNKITTSSPIHSPIITNGTDAFEVIVYLMESYKATFNVVGGDENSSMSASSKIDAVENSKSQRTIYVPPNDDVTFTANPGPGYEVKAWLVGERKKPDPGDPLQDDLVMTHYVNAQERLEKLIDGKIPNGANLFVKDELTRTVITTEIVVMVVLGPAPIKITTTDLDRGRLKLDDSDNDYTEYEFTLRADGIYGVPKWEIVGGKLPSGLRLNENSGTITGYPLEAGTFKFYVEVGDSRTKTEAPKSLEIVILNQVNVTYKITGDQNGEIDVKYEHSGRIPNTGDPTTKTIKAWEGDRVTFVAKPNGGFMVKDTDWKSNPQVSGTVEFKDDIYEYTVPGISWTEAASNSSTTPKTLTMEVTFSKRPVYSVYYSVHGGNGNRGTATLNGAAYNPGDSVTSGSVVITAQPNSGYRVKEWRMAAMPTNNAPSDFLTDSKYIVSKMNAYTVPPPSDPDNIYVMVVVIYEPQGSAVEPQIVMLPNDDGSAFLKPDATQGVKYEASFGIDMGGGEYEYATWTVTYDGGSASPPTYGEFKIDPNSGKLTGTPTAIPSSPGGYISMTVKADVYSKAGNLIGTPSRTLQLKILEPIPLTIDGTLPDGIMGFVYKTAEGEEVKIQYEGSEITQPWQLLSGGTGLPAGLSFDTATAVISGTPTASGTFTFNIRGTNAAGAKEQLMTLIIGAPEAPSNIQPESLPNAAAKVMFRQQLTADGVPASFTWALEDAPTWLSINRDTGELSGRPSAVGVYNFTVVADNGVAPPATKLYTINAVALTIIPPPPNGSVDIDYSHTFTLSGGTTSDVIWSWSAATGSTLPDGLDINPDTGEVSGTPKKTGEHKIVVAVAGKDGDFTHQQQFSIKISLQVPPIITTDAVLYGDVGIKFQEVLEADGPSPIEWKWTDMSGSQAGLPPGLVLSASGSGSSGSALYGIISGTPTKAGTYQVILSAISNPGTADELVGTKNITIVIRGIINVVNITGIPKGATTSESITIDATVVPSDATYQSIIWSLATMREIIENIKGKSPSTAEQWITELRSILSEAGIENPESLLNLTDDEEFIRELAARVGVSVPSNGASAHGLSVKFAAVVPFSSPRASVRSLTDKIGSGISLSAALSSAQMLAVIDNIIKNPPPYGNVTLTKNNIVKTLDGTVWLKATVENGLADPTQPTGPAYPGGPNFVDYSPIIFSNFVPVSDIIGVPTNGVAEVPLPVTGTIEPYTATNKTIEWSVKQTNITGVTLEDDVLTAPNAGYVILTATIYDGASASPKTNYTKDFRVNISSPVPTLKVIEPQSNELKAGALGSVTYAVETKYIADGVYTVVLNSPEPFLALTSGGSQMSSIQIKDGKGTLKVYAVGSSATGGSTNGAFKDSISPDDIIAGVYSLSIELLDIITTDGRDVDSIQSNNFACIINDHIIPTIIRPDELTDGPFPNKEVGGSLSQMHLPNASMNLQYNETLLTKGFEYTGVAGNEIIPPTYWRIINGTLPPGLVMTQWIEGTASGDSAPTNPQTGIPNAPTGSTGWDTGYARAGCVIEGKPTEAGIGKLYTFIVEVDEIVYFQKGTSVVWQKEGYETWAAANPNAEKITWSSGGINTIIFSGKKATRTINILVEPDIYYPATELTISPPNLSIAIGSSAPLSANVLSTGTGSPTNTASIQDVVWYTSNPLVATVDSYGNVSGISEGTAIIAATTVDKNITATRAVTVFNTPVTGLSLSDSTISLMVGKTEILRATVSPSNALNDSVIFNSSNPLVATIDADGIITAVSEGETTITVRTSGNRENGSPATASCKVTVTAIPEIFVTGITLNSTAISLTVGGMRLLTPTVSPPNAYDTGVTFDSSDWDVAIVDVFGNITALSEGEATITVRTSGSMENGNPAVATCIVTVKKVPEIYVTGITLNSTAISLTVGGMRLLTPTVTPSDAYNLGVTFDSSDWDVAIVDESGKITATGEGEATITVKTIGNTASGSPATATCKITVKKIPVVAATKVSINKTVVNLTLGDSETLTATVLPENASVRTVTWSSSNPDLVSVDPVTGKITAGGATITPVVITATVDQSGTAVKAECRVTVETSPVLEKISINKTVSRLIVGESEVLSVTVSPESSSKKTVTWKSSKPDFVSVDSVTGRITARKETGDEGPVIITATVDHLGAPVTAECRVDVDKVPIIEKISLNKSAAVIPVGMTEMLTATLMPVHANEYNRDSLIWRSLDENVASVDSKGNVTGKKVGTTVVEVGTTNGLLAKCAVEVIPISSAIQTFVDVNTSEWYFPYVTQAVSYGLVNGVGDDQFAPDRNVTRAEFVTMINRALNLTSQKNSSGGFQDVHPGDWYYNDIRIALSEGLLSDLIPDGDNNFYPNRAIRREEMAVILAAAASMQGLTSDLSPTTTLATPTNPDIADSQLITEQYAAGVETVYKLGLMNGFPDGTFDPQGVSTRAQATTVLVRLYHEIVRFDH